MTYGGGSMNDNKKAPAKAEADKDSMEQLRKLLNSNFEEKDVNVVLSYAPIVLCSYASRGTEERDVIVTVRGSENREVFEQLKKAVDKINRRRRHHGGEGVSFHISLVDTTSISS